MAMVTGMELVTVARVVLIVGICVLLALIVRAAVDRRNGPEEVCRRLPWWSAFPLAGYVAHAILGQAGRLEHDTLSWRFWLLSASTVAGIAAMGTVLQWKPRRRRPPIR